jgi:hypothetical protein
MSMVHSVKEHKNNLTFVARSCEVVNINSCGDSSSHQTRLLVRRAMAETDVSILNPTRVSLHESVVEFLPVPSFTALLECLFGKPA